MPAAKSEQKNPIQVIARMMKLLDVLAEGGDWIDVRGSGKHIQGYLKDFLFDPGLVDAKVGTLSGGERSRLQLLMLVLSGANFLLLDEPTNNLDIVSAEVLEQALAEN